MVCSLTHVVYRTRTIDCSLRFDQIICIYIILSSQEQWIQKQKGTNSIGVGSRDIFLEVTLKLHSVRIVRLFALIGRVFIKYLTSRPEPRSVNCVTWYVRISIALVLLCGGIIKYKSRYCHSHQFRIVFQTVHFRWRYFLSCYCFRYFMACLSLVLRTHCLTTASRQHENPSLSTWRSASHETKFATTAEIII